MGARVLQHGVGRRLAGEDPGQRGDDGERGRQAADHAVAGARERRAAISPARPASRPMPPTTRAMTDSVSLPSSEPPPLPLAPAGAAVGDASEPCAAAPFSAAAASLTRGAGSSASGAPIQRTTSPLE